jgi:hypothetical protein
MQALSDAAQEAYAGTAATDNDLGGRYLEKLVQLELDLPPPAEADMRRLPRGDAPIAHTDRGTGDPVTITSRATTTAAQRINLGRVQWIATAATATVGVVVGFATTLAGAAKLGVSGAGELFATGGAIVAVLTALVNHARLLTKIAREREMFGGSPELTPDHLGKWIVLCERWPHVASEISKQAPALTDGTPLDEWMAQRIGGDWQQREPDLSRLLTAEPRLGDMLDRLIYFRPASTASTPDRVVTGAL